LHFTTFLIHLSWLYGNDVEIVQHAKIAHVEEGITDHKHLYRRKPINMQRL